jgi:hypothetical protein
MEAHAHVESQTAAESISGCAELTSTQYSPESHASMFVQVVRCTAPSGTSAEAQKHIESHCAFASTSGCPE